MNRFSAPALILLLLAACKPAGEGMIALEGATLIDGSGGRPIDDALILIRGGKIETVARVNEVPIPKGAQRVNLVGKTIIPGLIDAHAHVERWAGPRYIAWGVTTVRDFGDNKDTALALKADFNLGAMLGPRVFSSAGMIDGVPPTYPGGEGVATPDEARHAVDTRAVAGADLLKIYTKITPALLTPLMDEARVLRLPVAAHLGRTDALTAARAGVVSIEHMSGVVQATARNPAKYLRAHDMFLVGWTEEEAGWSSLDSAALSRTARALAATHVALVPTLVIHETLAHLSDPAWQSPPGMQDVPADNAGIRDWRGLLTRTGWQLPDFIAFRRSRPKQNLFLREFKRAGGLVAAGSDAANQLLVPGAALHEEMAQLVAAGFTPIEAITAATRRGAQLLHADSLGMITVGKVADLVILNARPDTAIAQTRNIFQVMTRGRLISPDSLRTAWKQ